jgi:hypothetical protein
LTIVTDLDVTHPIVGQFVTGALGTVTPSVEFDVAPSIISTPSPSFIVGIVSLEANGDGYDMTQHVSDDGISPISYSLNPGVSGGLTFNTSTGILSYDGTGGAVTTNHTLIATDATGSDESSSFGIAVTANTAAEADWTYRTSLPGVVWYHDFQYDAEVDQFRESDGFDTDDSKTNSQQNSCYRQTSDGITGGGCLEMLRTDNTTPTEAKGWYRPTSPFTGATNGRGENDPADGGNITLETWTAPAARTSWDGTKGNYGPASTEGANTWDGYHYYFQFQMKLDPRRTVNPNSLTDGGFGGKLVHQNRLEQTLIAQTIVWSRGYDCVDWRPYWYSGGGGAVAVPNDVTSAPDFATDQWVEYLVHLVPGDENEDAASERLGNTRWIVWRRLPSEKGYTKIHEINDMSMDYQNAYIKAFNAIDLSTYDNLRVMGTDYWQRYDQLIFSKQWIPPSSTISSSTLKTAADSLSEGQWTDTPISMPSDIGSADISWQCRTAFYDDNRREIQLMGKPQASAGGLTRCIHWIYDEENNSWTTTATNLVPNMYGHIWMVTFDHTESPGDYYFAGGQPLDAPYRNQIRRYNRSTDSWETLTSSSFNPWSSSPSPDPGPCYHPNLLGPGRPGIYCFGNQGLSYYDVVNDSWTQVRNDIQYDATYGKGNGWGGNQSLYVPGLDIALWGSGANGFESSVPQGLVITSGGADDTTPTTFDMPAPITQSSNNSSANESCMMILDPTDPTQKTVMLLERWGNKVYTSNNPTGGLGAWTEETWTHPFGADNNPYQDETTAGSWTCCSIPRYGVVLGFMSQDGAGTILWKPGGTRTQV